MRRAGQPHPAFPPGKPKKCRSMLREECFVSGDRLESGKLNLEQPLLLAPPISRELNNRL